MEKKHYFNFPAFRKALYDAELSERAKVIYMHLLQKSSAKGSNEVELTKPQIANDLGILTKNRDALAPKNVQRALGELEAHGYLTKWQRYKGEGVPLTIKLNMNEEFLKQKRIEDAPNADKNEGTESQEPSENVHPYNHSLSSSNPFISSTNPSLSSSNHSEPDSSEEVEDEDKKLEKEFSEETPMDNMDDWEVVSEQHQNINGSQAPFERGAAPMKMEDKYAFCCRVITEKLESVNDFRDLSDVGSRLREEILTQVSEPLYTKIKEFLNKQVKQKAEGIKVAMASASSPIADISPI